MPVKVHRLYGKLNCDLILIVFNRDLSLER